jgi:hypothetical protein
MLGYAKLKHLGLFGLPSNKAAGIIADYHIVLITIFPL